MPLFLQQSGIRSMTLNDTGNIDEKLAVVSAMALEIEGAPRNFFRDVSLASYSMKEIAYDLNFNDMSHFSKFFKSMCGVSFSAYKRGKLSGAA